MRAPSFAGSRARITTSRAAALLLAASLLSLLTGCATYQAYDGPKLPRAQVAVVEGSGKIRSGLPLALVIRSVDGRSVGLQYSRVALAPGSHELLVDCEVSGSPSGGAAVSRHALRIEVAAGGKYRLTARMSAGNRSCADVGLE